MSEDENAEWVDLDDLEEELEGEDADEGDQSDKNDEELDTEGDGKATKISEELLKRKRLSGAQKRKMRMLQAVAAGEKVLTRAERKKRKQEDGTTNSETINGDAKKVKTEAGEKEAVPPGAEEESVSLMRLAVVLVGYPELKMTKKQAEIVERALIEKINPSDSGDPIQFSATEYENGGLAFTCANRATKVWLHRTALKLVPWPGARLLVEHAELTLKGGKFIMWLLKIIKKRDNQQIFDMLEKQNKGVSTAEWRVLKRVPEAKDDKRERERMSIWVDDKSYETLKERNFQLFLGLGRATFMQWSEWRNLKEGPSAAKPPAVRNVPQPLMNYKPQSKFISQHPQLAGPGPRFPRQSRGPILPSPGPRFPRQSRGPRPPSPGPRFPRQSRGPRPPSPGPRFRQSRGPRPPSPGPRFPRQSRGPRRESPPRLQKPRFEGRVWSQGHAPVLVQDDPPNLLEALLLAANRPLPQERVFTDSPIIAFNLSEQPRELGFGLSERSQPRESGFVVSDQGQPRESRYTSDQPQENRFFASRLQQPREGGYASPDRSQHREMNYTGSNQLSPRETRFATLDQALSRDSRFVRSDRAESPDTRYMGRDESQNQRFRGSDQLPSRDSRFGGPDQMQSRDGGFVEQNSLFTREPRLGMSNSSRFAEYNDVSRMPRSREERFSDFQQPQQSGSSYTNWTHSRFSRPSDSSRANW